MSYADSIETVDLKYVTSQQIIEVVYEGHTLRFRAEGLSSRDDPDVETITRDIRGLSLDSANVLWSVSWETMVAISEQDAERKDNKVYTSSSDVIEYSCQFDRGVASQRGRDGHRKGCVQRCRWS